SNSGTGPRRRVGNYGYPRIEGGYATDPLTRPPSQEPGVSRLMYLARTSCVVLLSLAVAEVRSQTYFPAPPAPADNPVTTEKALLGMALFWEEQLSSSNTT